MLGTVINPIDVLHDPDEEVELDFEPDLRAQDAWRESQLMQETGGLGSMARGIMRPGGRHTIVCKHWLRDLCMKGDKCDFLHQYDLARMPECVQWSRFGKCPDNDCDFRHDTEKMECQKYKFGFCKLGSQCRMRHDKLSRAYLPETIPDWYLREIIPNIFDFVPKLPEEGVRVTTGFDEQSSSLPSKQPVGADPVWVAQQHAWSVPQSGSPWAVTESAWAAPTVSRTPKSEAIDLTDDKRRRGKGARDEQVRPDDRAAAYKRNRWEDNKRGEQSYDKRDSGREAVRDDKRDGRQPERRDEKRDRTRDERDKPERWDERRRVDDRRGTETDRRDEKRGDERRREADQKGGEWWERQDQSRRRRSRSTEKKRSDRDRRR
jgi:cleavage and polyadenylation specificity factor subunit 4